MIIVKSNYFEKIIVGTFNQKLNNAYVNYICNASSIIPFALLFLLVAPIPSNVYAHITDSACPGGGVGFGCVPPDWHIQLSFMNSVTHITMILLIFGMLCCVLVSVNKHRKSTDVTILT